MATLIDFLKNGNISKQEFMKSFQPINPDAEDQLSIHSKNAIDCFNVLDFKILKGRNDYVKQNKLFAGIGQSFDS